jgi:hypothetical protein
MRNKSVPFYPGVIAGAPNYKNVMARSRSISR